jgi:hypothetical protein
MRNVNQFLIFLKKNIQNYLKVNNVKLNLLLNFIIWSFYSLKNMIVSQKKFDLWKVIFNFTLKKKFSTHFWERGKYNGKEGGGLLI